VWINAWASLSSSISLWGTAIAVCYALNALLPGSHLLHLLIGAMVFLAVGFLYVRSPALSGADRDIIASIAGQKVSRLLRRVGVLRALKAP
jgi:hypothetical protein